MSIAQPKRPRLKVASAEKRRFIDVPCGDAKALHDYLRLHRVHSAPPEPSSTGTDTIQLAPGVDAKAVQSLLNKWR